VFCDCLVTKDEDMSVIEVDPTLIQEIRAYSNAENDDLRSVVEDALRQHLFRLRQQKIDQECDAYQRNYPQIAGKYLGQFVAVHNGEVIDADNNGVVLSKRIREKFGRVPIAIIQVRETPEWPVIRVRSPRLVSLAKDEIRRSVVG
jgi:hypothetical protein